MRVRKARSGVSFGLEALTVIGDAFEQAWASIEGNFGDGPARDAARIKLAAAILSFAKEDSQVAALKREGLSAMALDYRHAVGANPAVSFFRLQTSHRLRLTRWLRVHAGTASS
jgi:hypothetical protein